MEIKKTWQREVAAVLFMALIYLGYQEQTAELEILVWPFTVFGMAAFGLKQSSVQAYLGK